MAETYTRKLSIRELKILGPGWRERIDISIANMLISSSMADTAGVRTLSIMAGGEPMTVAGILSVYEMLYGAKAISLNYLHHVVRSLWTVGKIRRIARGVYQKLMA